MAWLHSSTHEILSLYQFGASAGSTLQRMMSKKIFLCIKMASKMNFFQLKMSHTGQGACSIWRHWASMRHFFLLPVACNLSLSGWGNFRAIENFWLSLWMDFFDSFNFYCVEPESGRDGNGVVRLWQCSSGLLIPGHLQQPRFKWYWSNFLTLSK